MSTHLSRRDLLAGLAGASLVPALPSFAWPQSGALPSNPDVAIIGAGSAGLAAARALIAAGKSVAVLEAMNRIGGRAFTESETFGVPFDWGCAWIHSADRNPYFPLAKEWGFDLAQHDDSLDRVYYGSRRFTAKEMRRISRIRAEIVRANAAAAKKRDGAVSSIRAIRTPEEQVAATFMGPMDMAVDFDELAIRDYDDQAELEPNYLVREGFGAVVRRFGEGVPVSAQASCSKPTAGRSRRAPVSLPCRPACCARDRSASILHSRLGKKPPSPTCRWRCSRRFRCSSTASASAFNRSKTCCASSPATRTSISLPSRSTST